MTADIASLHDPTSVAYKKARRNYNKSTKHRPDTVESDWTPFRAAEKRFKARFPPPDLSEDVLDLAVNEYGRKEEVENGWWQGRVPKEGEVREVGLGEKRGYAFPDIPGLILLPNFIAKNEQRELIRWALRDHARPPNVTNLDTHYAMPPDGLWSMSLVAPDEIIQPIAQTSTPSAEIVEQPAGPRSLISNTPASPDTLPSLIAVPKPAPPPSSSVSPLSASSLLYKLRWANIGWFYHWTSKMYDFTKGKQDIDERVRKLCKDAVGCVRWGNVFQDESDEGWENGKADWDTWNETYEPDAGIVNFYQEKDTLMGHVDRSEVCATSPLVSISLGNAAVFLIGGQSRDVKPVPILLRSGDVIIMSGPQCRRAYHGVPRILEGTLPKHLSEDVEEEDWASYAKYMRTTRINVNVRQVFPKGFEPPIS